MRKILLAAAAMAALTGTAEATPVTISYNFSNAASAAGAPTITNTQANPFTLDLALNTPQTVSLANVFEIQNNIGTIDADFAFSIFGSPATFSLTGVDTELATTILRTTFLSNTLIWEKSLRSAVITFATGAVLDVTMGNATYTGVSTGYAGLDVPVTFNLVAAPVPEPGTLALLATALMGFASLLWLRKNRAA